MSDRAAKQALYDAFARIGKALSSGRRNEIVDVLANGERTVEGLAEEVGLSVANTSRHLQILRSAGLVAGRREGTFVHYRLADPEVLDFWRRLQGIAGARLAEVERLARAYLGPEELEPVTKEELMRRLRAGEDIVLVDVRPAPEYEAAHIAGAVSIPLPELERRLRDLPRDREVVAYCRGRYCAFATDAVSEMRRRGIDARRLEDGLPDWAAAGLPVEEG